MKQTKKLTWSQREFLQKRRINIEGLRCIEETKYMLKLLKPDGTVLIVDKN